jgi:ribosomal-protein-alanine N-acetyltransferase
MDSTAETTTERPKTPPASPAPSLLTGRRLHLRPMLQKDREEMYQRSLDLESRGRFFPLNISSQVSAEAAFGTDGRWGPEVGILVVVQNSDEALVGYVSFEHTVSDVDELNLGYFTYPEFRGQGYVSEALRLFVEYLFAMRRDVNRAALYIHPDNDKSMRVAERCGFTLEGRIREGWFNLGQWHDVLVYGLLRRELADGHSPLPAERR